MISFLANSVLSVGLNLLVRFSLVKIAAILTSRRLFLFQTLSRVVFFSFDPAG